ncbi:heat shock protein 30 [Microthyrium microscopicum]|uniref:Heat shock protein 30 n=1 Tax=Microthyrium microscopicum TaxID=703497 RepID=A0A6A6UBY1_9PEZI|nr:heat shock protein 30 [Microthyrium microscopicum]
MSIFFPRFQQELSPIFRLADEIDRCSRQQSPAPSRRAAVPRFDVKETQEAYELTGELPGIEQEAVSIEWSDFTTLSIKGHTAESSSTTNSATETEAEVSDNASTTSEDSTSYHAPTVEDEGADEKTTTAVAEPATPAETVKAEAPKPKVWINERYYGSFHRTFKFPQRVEQDEVKASLKNGVLSIVVPKSKAREPRKISIA